MAIVDWRVTPQIAINDPNLMVGMPPALTAATGVYMKARDKMAYGQYLAGIAFNNASLGYRKKVIKLNIRIRFIV